MQITIRNMISKDVNVVLDILKKSTTDDDAVIQLVSEQIETYLSNPEQNEYQFVVALDDTNRVCAYACFGYISGAENSYRLYNVVVPANLQHQGIGRALLHHVESEIAKHQGRLLLVELPDRPASIIFLEKNGYQSPGRIPSYFGRGMDIVFLLKYFRT